MDPILLAAILNFAARYGIPAVIEFLQHPKTTIDDAIVALGKAADKSLAQYIAEDAAERLKATTHATALK